MISVKTLKTLLVSAVIPFISVAAINNAYAAKISKKVSVVEQQKTYYKTQQVGEINMFYRESGPKDAPVVLLLHGFPTSSHMYRNLIPRLSDEYRVIAPDLPGFGSTTAPKRGEYDYTFHNLYKAVEGFTEELKLKRYSVMVFDYGAPVGFRLAAANPKKVTAIITQNGNAYDEGLEDSWGPIRAYWQTPSQKNRDQLRGLLTAGTTHFQYTSGVPKHLLSLVSPDAQAHDQAILDREPELQLDLFGDYKTNVALYPKWQKYFRKYQPPLLAVWGNKDPFFGAAGAKAFKRDIKNAEVHLYDTGHFALETHGEEIAVEIKKFLRKNVGK